MFRKPLISWFGYTRRERRASMILLIIMVIVLAARYLIPQRPVMIEDLSAVLVPTGDKDDFYSSRNDLAEMAAPAARKPVSSGKPSGVFSRQVSKIELNTCDSSDLERLPMIGPVLSVRIIKYRNLLGGYTSVEQLKEVYGLRDSTYYLISGRITADTALLRRIRINSADFTELDRHPYLSRSDVQAILKYREITGKIRSITDLVNEKILTRETSLKISPYIRFD